MGGEQDMQTIPYKIPGSLDEGQGPQRTGRTGPDRTNYTPHVN